MTRQRQPLRAAPRHDNARSLQAGKCREQQSQWARTDDDDAVAGHDGAGVYTMQGAGQRFGERSRDKRGRRSKLVEVLTNDWFRHEQIFGISSIQQKQVFAQAITLSLTVIALQTRRGIGDHDGVALGTLCDPRADDCNYTRDLVSKTGGCVLKKQGMPAPVGFYICAT